MFQRIGKLFSKAVAPAYTAGSGTLPSPVGMEKLSPISNSTAMSTNTADQEKLVEKLANRFEIHAKESIVCQKDLLAALEGTAAIPPEFNDDVVSLEIYKSIGINECGHWLDAKVTLEATTGCSFCPMCRAELNNETFKKCPDLQKIIDDFIAEKKALKTRLEVDSLNLFADQMKKEYKEYQDKIEKWVADFKRLKLEYQVKSTLINQLTKQLGKLPVELDYKEPALASCGHYLESKVVQHNCPSCGKKTEESEPFFKVGKNSELNLLRAKREALFKKVDTDIKGLPTDKLNKEWIEKQLEAQKKPVEVYKTEEKRVLAGEENKKRYNHFFNRDRIAEFKLDKTDHAHLAYWNAKTDRCWHGFGGVEIVLRHDGQDLRYRVPTGIAQIMNEITAGQKRVQTDTLDRHRFINTMYGIGATRSMWYHQKRVTRSPEAEAIYASTKLETLRLG